MRQHDNSILYSPSDLVRYLGCAHATALDLARLREPAAAPQQAEDDAMGKLVQHAGLEHEDGDFTPARASKRKVRNWSSASTREDCVRSPSICSLGAARFASRRLRNCRK